MLLRGEVVAAPRRGVGMAFAGGSLPAVGFEFARTLVVWYGGLN